MPTKIDQLMEAMKPFADINYNHRYSIMERFCPIGVRKNAPGRPARCVLHTSCQDCWEKEAEEVSSSGMPVERDEEIECLRKDLAKANDEIDLFVEDLVYAKRRIKALECAALSCRTCMFESYPIDSRECLRCKDVRYGGYIFDVTRFSDKAVTIPSISYILDNIKGGNNNG